MHINLSVGVITKELKFKDALLSNFDMIDWGKYLKVPIRGIFSHTENE